MSMKKILAAAAIACIVALALPGLAFAAGGNGSGGGQGGNSDEPLTVESASIQPNATVKADESITLTFSKNVVNAAVRDTNSTLITLADSTGKPVEITVKLADDQVEPDLKNNIVVTPVKALEGGKYTLTAKAGITAKNGAVMAEDYTLTFEVSSGINPIIIIGGIVVIAAIAGGVIVSRRKAK